jgi:hypothetical protein
LALLAGSLACRAHTGSAPEAAEVKPALDKPRLERDQGAGVELVYQSRIAAALAIPGRLIVLESDVLHLHGVEPGEGEIMWRRRIADEPRAATLHAEGFRILVHAGESLTVVDARDGRILGRSDDAPSLDQLGVEVREGVCAYVGPCELALFDCTTAARRGAPLTATVTADGSCEAPPHALGSTPQDVIVRRGPHGPGTEIVAVDPSGRTRWSLAVAMAPDLQGGVIEELDAVWIWDRDSVAALRGSTGEIRWRAPIGFEAEEASVEEGLVVVIGRDGGRPMVAAWDLASGHERWRRRLRLRRIPLLEGRDRGPLRADRSRVYELIAPQTGESVGRMAAGRDETVWRDVDGGFVRTDGDLEELSAHGEILRQRPYTGGDVLAIGATHLVSRVGSDLLFHDRIALWERARLVGGFDVDPSSAALGPHRVLLRRQEARGATVLVLALEPRRRRGPQ